MRKTTELQQQPVFGRLSFLSLNSGAAEIEPWEFLLKILLNFCYPLNLLGTYDK